MTDYATVKKTLNSLVPTDIFGAHGAFWKNLSRDEFVSHSVFGYPLVEVGNGPSSNLIKALRGLPPFGLDQRTPGAFMRRMPAGLPAASEDDMQYIERWINEGCPEGKQKSLQTLEYHRAFWFEFDNWSLFNRMPEVDNAISKFYPLVGIWINYAIGLNDDGQWKTAIEQTGVINAFKLLSQKQLETFHKYYGNPLRENELFDSFALFGADALGEDASRPGDPHRMNGPEMWFFWAAFAEACMRKSIDSNFWLLMQRLIFTGLAHDGIIRKRFNVLGFENTSPPIKLVIDYATSLSENQLPEELKTRTRESGLFIQA